MGQIISYFCFILERFLTRLRSWLWRLRLEAKGATVGPQFVMRRGSAFRLGQAVTLKIGSGVILDEDATLFVGDAGQLTLGDHVFIGRRSVVVANLDVTIGHGTQLAHFVTVIDTDHRFTDLHRPLVDQGDERKAIRIGSEVWLATQAVVLKGRTVGDHAVVGAGTIVSRDVAPGKVVVGPSFIEI